MQKETDVNPGQSCNQEVSLVQEPAEQMNTVKQAVGVFKLLKGY